MPNCDRKTGVGSYARVGGANVLRPPIVVHLVDAVDQREPWFGEVVGQDIMTSQTRRAGSVL